MVKDCCRRVKDTLMPYKMAISSAVKSDVTKGILPPQQKLEKAAPCPTPNFDLSVYTGKEGPPMRGGMS